ncbi:serine/arginine repetitive matrix protein 1-like [Panicum virgatum]|uniref:serine/arginine repetitive matrix protein 1-like n=1 Tax=Panicum virgatum TaxID=38727 RepID=UPI0019D5386D|nr:serine/arginine repetitive matrix protein 1-like [Panicum virgatum]
MPGLNPAAFAADFSESSATLHQQLPAETRRAEQGRAAGERAEQGRTAARPRARARQRPSRGAATGGRRAHYGGAGARRAASALRVARGSRGGSIPFLSLSPSLSVWRRRSCSAELCAGQPHRVTTPPSLPLGRHAVGPPAPPRHAELPAGPPRRRTEEEEPQSRPARRVPAPSHHDAALLAQLRAPEQILLLDGDHGEGRLGLDGSFGVEESTCLWPLYGNVSRAYLQQECNLIVVLKGKLMHAGLTT